MGIFKKLFGAPKEMPGPEPPFEPVNELERKLAEFVREQKDAGPLIQCLLGSQVFILLKNTPEEVREGRNLRPLVLASSTGFPGVCVFTSPERSGPVSQENPEYTAGLLVAFPWVLQTCPADLGLIVNPGWATSIEQSPGNFATLRDKIASGEFK
jgi:hypothetical protein